LEEIKLDTLFAESGRTKKQKKTHLTIATLYLSEINITNRALIVKINTLMSISKAQCSKYATAISIERLVFLAR
jgi:hypothetical protein